MQVNSDDQCSVNILSPNMKERTTVGSTIIKPNIPNGDDTLLALSMMIGR